MEPVGTNRESQANKRDAIIKNDKNKSFLLITVPVPSMTGKQTE
jgi:hypothetical protein